MHTRPDIFARSPARRVVPNLSLNGCSRFTAAWTRGTQRIFYSNADKPIVPDGVAFVAPSVYGRHYVGYVNGSAMVVPRCKTRISGCSVLGTTSTEQRFSKYVGIALREGSCHFLTKRVLRVRGRSYICLEMRASSILGWNELRDLAVRSVPHMPSLSHLSRLSSKLYRYRPLNKDFLRKRHTEKLHLA